MRRIYYLFLSLLLIVAFSLNCISNKKVDIPITPFNISNLNKVRVKGFNDTNLNNQDYQRITVDLLVYEKIDNDTIVQLEIDTDTELIRLKSWRIRLDKNDDLYISNFIRKKYGILSLNFNCNSEVYSFSAIKLEDNSVFLCHISKEKNNYYLNINYYNPYAKVNL